MKCSADVFWSSGRINREFRIDVEGDLDVSDDWVVGYASAAGLHVMRVRSDRMSVVLKDQSEGATFAADVIDVAARFERALTKMAETEQFAGLTFEVKAVDNYDHPDGSFCEPQDGVTEVA